MAQRSYRGARVAALLALALAAGAGVGRPAQAQTAFADPAFQRNWERADKPVADKKADRSWYWGPSPGFSTMEPNKESPGGQRLVQYFDKARMEINDPAGDQSKPFYVTNGLLATELMTGRMQTGDGVPAALRRGDPAGLGHGRRERADLCDLWQADERAEDQRRGPERDRRGGP